MYKIYNSNFAVITDHLDGSMYVYFIQIFKMIKKKD